MVGIAPPQMLDLMYWYPPPPGKILTCDPKKFRRRKEKKSALFGTFCQKIPFFRHFFTIKRVKKGKFFCFAASGGGENFLLLPEYPP